MFRRREVSRLQADNLQQQRLRLFELIRLFELTPQLFEACCITAAPERVTL